MELHKICVPLYCGVLERRREVWSSFRRRNIIILPLFLVKKIKIKRKILFRAMAGSEERIKGSMVELELEERTPESWEMADLEENMKKLLAATQVSSSSSSSASMVSAVDCRGVGGEVVGVLDSVVGGHRGVEQVDSFLREALQNPRDRLTSKFVFLWCSLGIWVVVLRLWHRGESLLLGLFLKNIG